MIGFEMSDPNSSSLNVSSESIDVPGGVVTVQSPRSRSSSNSTPRGRSSKSKSVLATHPKKVSQAIRSMPKPSEREGLVVPASKGSGSSSAHRSHSANPPGSGHPPDIHYHQSHSVEYHFNVGVDPHEYGRVVSEAQQMLKESESRVQQLEGIAQQVYQEACEKIMHLMTIAQNLHEACITKDQALSQLDSQVQSVKSQLEIQVQQNSMMSSQYQAEQRQATNLLGHKDSEITRLMGLVDDLKLQNDQLSRRCQEMELSLAAPSASQSGGLSRTVVQSSPTVVSSDPQLHQSMASLMEVVQNLSERMSTFENYSNPAITSQSHNSAAMYQQPSPVSHDPPPGSNALQRPVPSASGRGSGGPGFPPSGGPDDGFDDDDEEELVEDGSPTNEKDIVDSRSLQHAKLETIPSSAADFRSWKNSLIMLMGRIDISGIDYLTTWINVAFKVDSSIECGQSSGLVPRLDRWLASELMKGLKGVPELHFKVQGYVESCARSGTAPRGRSIVHMVSRHFDLDRVRGSLITSQSVFLVELNGYSVSDLQEFSSQLMKVLNQIPHEQWPNQRMLGEFLFHKLRTVRRLERVIDEIKRSPENSEKRDFDFLWGRLQEFLVEEREDLNARSIEQSLRNPKKVNQPKAESKAKALGAAAPSTPAKSGGQPSPAVKAVPATPKTSDPKAKGKGPGKGKGKSKEEKSKTPCIFHQMPSGCIHGENCAYSHAAPPKAPPPKAKPAPKPKASGPSPKVAAAVAIVTALSSVVCPTQGFNSLEWAADTGAGRHLVSFESLRGQGFGDDMFKDFVNQSHEDLRFSTGGGQRNSSQAIGFRDQEGVFGDANHFVLDSCPCVRSVGLDVQDGLGFVWLPGESPFYIKDCSKIRFNCDDSNKIKADRVVENVPFFSRKVEVIPGLPVEVIPDSEPARGSDGIILESDVAPDLRSVVAPDDRVVDQSSVAAEIREVNPEVPVPRLPEGAIAARHEALSTHHQLTHFPKNSLCDVCNRSRLYSRRVKSHRVPDESVDLPEPEAFGQQIACDHIIVFKSAKGGRDHAVLIVQDRFSKVTQAYPTFSRESSQLAAHLKHFVGLKSSSFTVVRSDAANEILKAVFDNGWLPEFSVPGRFPHNSILEREIRTFQEIARSVFLQAGFAARPQLWPQACGFVATAMSAFIPNEDGQTRWNVAFGSDFLGPQYLLGQLGFVRTKDQGKFKFSPNAEPAIFVGWRLDFGLRYRGVLYFVLYSSLKEDSASYPVSQFHESEVYFQDEVTFPLSIAAEAALKDLSDPKLIELHDIDSIPIPFTGAEIKKKSRRVYITYARMLKIGATPGCKGCEKDTSSHSHECVARFEEAFGVKDKDGDLVEPVSESRGEIPEIDPVACSPDDDGFYEPGTPLPDEVDDEAMERDLVPECPPASDEEGEETRGVAAIVSIAQEFHGVLKPDQLQESFGDRLQCEGVIGCSGAAAQSEADLNPKRNRHASAGGTILYEFCCDKNSTLGVVGEEQGVNVIRLCRESIDLSSKPAIEQLCQQVKGSPGCAIHGALECRPWSQWQRLNRKKNPRLCAALDEDQKQSLEMLESFIKVANIVLDGGGEVSFEWPRYCDGWKIQVLLSWILERNLFSSTFPGCALGVTAKDGVPARKPWRIVTSCKRLAENLSALRCTHAEHAPLEGKYTRASAFYPRPFCNIILQSMFPHVVNQHVFSMPCDVKTQHCHRPKHMLGTPCLPIDIMMNQVGNQSFQSFGLVHRLLDRDEWRGRPEVYAAIDSEKAGLLAEGTWKEDEIASKDDFISMYPNETLHFGSLMTIVSIKGFEKEVSDWKIKARIVFRGDNVRDSDGLSAVFQELQASAPSSISGLNSVMCYAMLPGHTCTTSDCIRAYIQCVLKTAVRTFVLLPPELVPASKKHILRPAAPLHKALYGHPESSAHWGNHLAEVLRTQLGGVEWPNLPSVWWFGSSRMMLSVYVDDLTLSGEESRHSAFWETLQQHINLDPPTEFGRVLGRDHVLKDRTLILSSADFAKQCVQLYEELSSKKAKPSKTPTLEEGSLVLSDSTDRGQLAPVAARLVMKLMWLCRTARPDLMFGINVLAKHITCWSSNDDKRAARLVGYLSSTIFLAHEISFTKGINELHLALYPDADFGGDPVDMKSTSGFVLALEGEGSFGLLSWGSRKQKVVSRSTTEAEFVSLSSALFSEGLPFLEVWQDVCPTMRLVIHEDNSAVVSIVGRGFSQKLKHLSKTHKINVASTCDAITQNDDVSIQIIETHLQRGDIMTKGLNIQKLLNALNLLHMSEHHPD